MTTTEIKNMRSRTANWYETTVRYEKTMEDGMQKKISELYVVDAVSFGDAEITPPLKSPQKHKSHNQNH